MSTAATSLPLNHAESNLDHEAIKYFERAIEKEAQGLMSDAVENYRKAFRINDRVDTLYRNLKVPSAMKKLTQERGKNVGTRVDEKEVAKINVDFLIKSFANLEVDGLHMSTHEDEENMTVAQPSPLVHLPKDIWLYILEVLVITLPESWFKMSITCKKFAYIGFGSSSIWRLLCQLVYPKQRYEENEGRFEPAIPDDQLQMVSQYTGWKHMLSKRPFVKFQGCYISVINYYSEGARGESSLSWTNPVRTITYYRYLRFYPDGTVLKVLTILPPDQVVAHLQIDNPLIPHDEKHNKESHRIYRGKWTINSDGEIHIRIDQGSVDYLIFHYYFTVKSLGINKHAKLTWNQYYAQRKEIENDDRSGEISEYSIRNEKPFKFLRVRSYQT